MSTDLHTVFVLAKILQDILRRYSEGEKMWNQLYRFDYQEWWNTREDVYRNHGWLQSGMVYLPARTLQRRLLEDRFDLIGFFHNTDSPLLSSSPVEPLRSDTFASFACYAPPHLHNAQERFSIEPINIFLKSAPENPLEEESFHIQREEYLRLREKTSETILATVRACERMAKDQEQIEQLKMETRARLTQMHAA